MLRIKCIQEIYIEETNYDNKEFKMMHCVSKFEKGNQYVNVLGSISSNELIHEELITEDFKTLKIHKFIPASGAATRMFKDLYSFLESNKNNETTSKFFEYIREFPFYDEIIQLSVDKEFENDLENQSNIVNILLEEMDYGTLPKALLKFHKYEDRTVTPLEEHLYEASFYLNDDVKRLHFTISREHEDAFNDELAKLDTEGYEITYSFQKKSTDTLAVDMNHQPFIKEDGELLYRAGGHGALIENLNDIDADIIFIKNIDNVCHRRHIDETITYKKKLASIGYELKKKIDLMLHDLDDDEFDLVMIKKFLYEYLNMSVISLTKEKARYLLDRPLRVCGLVVNQGEPGGGPFIVQNDGYTDVQICEKVEIDLSLEEQKSILEESKYFNPVDLVCFVRDYKGEKYNLLNFINKDRYFISEKTYKGQKIKALEHPGLWNGAMHNWNTAFVEVPLITFNPVKSVVDLLKDGHS